MNVVDESLGNVLLVGLGVVVIQVVLDLCCYGVGCFGVLNYFGWCSQWIVEVLVCGVCL